MQQVFELGGATEERVEEIFVGWGMLGSFFLSKVTAYAFMTIKLLLFFPTTSVMLLDLKIHHH